jgi:hypothetical protein
MSIYGGILRSPIEAGNLSKNFDMSEWTFYKCSSDVFENASREQKLTNFLPKILPPFVMQKQ